LRFGASFVGHEFQIDQHELLTLQEKSMADAFFHDGRFNI